MAITLEQLEERLSRVERELEVLKRREKLDPRPWWEQIAGDFAHDEAFAEIARLGAQWRRMQVDDEDWVI